MYCGPLDQATAHFDSIGFPCPNFYNPADHFIRVMSRCLILAAVCCALEGPRLAVVSCGVYRAKLALEKSIRSGLATRPLLLKCTVVCVIAPVRHLSAAKKPQIVEIPHRVLFGLVVSHPFSLTLIRYRVNALTLQRPSILHDVCDYSSPVPVPAGITRLRRNRRNASRQLRLDTVTPPLSPRHESLGPIRLSQREHLPVALCKTGSTNAVQIDPAIDDIGTSSYRRWLDTPHALLTRSPVKDSNVNVHSLSFIYGVKRCPVRDWTQSFSLR